MAIFKGTASPWNMAHCQIDDLPCIFSIAICESTRVYHVVGIIHDHNNVDGQYYDDDDDEDEDEDDDGDDDDDDGGDGDGDGDDDDNDDDDEDDDDDDDKDGIIYENMHYHQITINIHAFLSVQFVNMASQSLPWLALLWSSWPVTGRLAPPRNDLMETDAVIVTINEE